VWHSAKMGMYGDCIGRNLVVLYRIHSIDGRNRVYTITSALSLERLVCETSLGGIGYVGGSV
jgi:hypothetical protein